MLRQFMLDVGRNLRFMGRADVSANGEQLLLLENLPDRGLFLEIGAGHPIALSNTFALSQQGWRGRAFDAQKHLRPIWRVFRRKTDFRVAAVTDLTCDSISIHRFPASWWTLSTIDADRAARASEHHGLPVDVEEVPNLHVVEAWKQFTADFGRPPDLLHLDVEGIDGRLLAALFRGIPASERPRFVLIEVPVDSPIPPELNECSLAGRRGKSLLFIGSGGYFSDEGLGLKSLE